MTSLTQALIFFLIPITFGFLSANLILCIRSIPILIPVSVSLGISTYICFCHLLSYIFGPQKASMFTLLLLFFISVILIISNSKKLQKFESEILPKQLITISLIGIIISLITFSAITKFGPFDNDYHIPLALTLYHNDIYPPKDFFRPEYILLYHFGGDLIAGALNHFSQIDIYKSFEILCALMSGTIFLSFFAISFIITKNYRVSLLSALCTYFGGGLLWLDAIIRYFANNFPAEMENWDFLQSFIGLGIHGSITNAPSVCTMVSTYCTGCPILILCLIIFWSMVQNKSNWLSYIIFLNISLLSLFLCAEWLYVTFWAGVLPFSLLALKKKDKRILLYTITALVISILINKTIGNALFLQDTIQHLGRANIFNIALKKNLFTIVAWGRLGLHLNNYKEIGVLSWDFLSEFGLSLLLFPAIIFYLVKSKNQFALLVFLCAIFTMPIPLFIDFKINPVDLNRFFGFGNSILIILIFCSLGNIVSNFKYRNMVYSLLITGFCFSPICGIFLASTISPLVTFSKVFAYSTLENLYKVRSIKDFNKFIFITNDSVQKLLLGPLQLYRDELKFLKENSSSGDVAISTLPVLPFYAGLYTVIPAGIQLYKDVVYSRFDSIYTTCFSTLDPHLLDELNIKWIIISSNQKSILSEESKKNLNVYCERKYQITDLEIYKVKLLKGTLQNIERKSAWILIDKSGYPAELSLLNSNTLNLFPSSVQALKYLASLQTNYSFLKSETIVSQVFIIDKVENQMKSINQSINIKKNF